MIAAMENSPAKSKMSVMELARPPDPAKDAVVTGAVTVISVQHGADGSSVTPVITEHASNVKYYQACNGVITETAPRATIIKSECTSYGPSPGGISCYSHEDDDDGSGSDGEVSKIDFTGVNLRTKKKRVVDCEDSQDGFQEPERPMSWEGELSDTEMGVITGHSQQEGEEMSMEGVQMCEMNTGGVLHHSSMLNNHDDDNKPPPVRFTESIIQTGKMMDEAPVKQYNQSSNSANSLPPNAVFSDLPLLVDKLLSNGGGTGYNTTPSHSPILQQRHQHIKHTQQAVPPTPSPDSAIHSVYSYSSPTQSPVTSRHGSSHGLPSSGFSSPYTPSLSRNNSDASQYGGSQHSSCYSYSSVSMSPTQYSPTHSPIQSRHVHNHTGFTSQTMQSRCTGSPLHAMGGGVIYGVSVPRSGLVSLPGAAEEILPHDGVSTETADEWESNGSVLDDKVSSLAAELIQHSTLAAPPGISRQQLINSPCPICGDKISGFHYGIFSCESCKGFFKRTVQNRKNYVCLRGSSCPVTIATRKKCPACRFEKCLKMGMKLEAIREDRTRGGRSTYQCSYTLPTTLVTSPNCENSNQKPFAPSGDPQVKLEAPDVGAIAGNNGRISTSPAGRNEKLAVPQLLQEIMDVEHLWHCKEQEAMKNSVNGTETPLNNNSTISGNSSSCSNSSTNCSTNTTVTVAGTSTNNNDDEGSSVSNNNSDYLSNLCSIADLRLYRLVKWCKSLPLFKNISIDDQISLLLNAWCELLLFSCCFRSVSTPGEIKVSLGKSINITQARDLGLGPCIERMLNFTDHLRRLKVDKYEYVAMKVIVLLSSDAGDLKEPEKVRASQEKALQALQHYTLSHYPDIPSKFGELLLRIPELQRTCQVGKDMLTPKNKDEEQGFTLLMELLRGDH